MTPDKLWEILRRARPESLITLDKLEEILRRETSIIAPQDVAILMATVYAETQTETPQRLVDEAERNNDAY